MVLDLENKLGGLVRDQVRVLVRVLVLVEVDSLVGNTGVGVVVT